MSLKKDFSGSLALVTGASSGIGLCFCRELASRGSALVMVSNQEKELPEAADAIRKEFGVNVHPFYLDLTVDGVVGKIESFLAENSLDPDILINNAGIFSFNTIEETPERKIDCFIDLHVGAVTLLSRYFATRFRKRGGGYILNMSSMSCWMPMPGIAMYSATKSYIRVFSRALHYEMRDYGVKVTVACPGGIATNLFGLPENLLRLAVNIKVLDTPESFVRKALKRMKKGKAQYINGMLNRISILFVGMTPTPVRMMIKHKMLDRGIRRP